MTQRERQLLRWIEENPMISQQELAEKAGITRSSVAVHISNLMKKGYITGKGYIVHSALYMVVIGGVTLEIGGYASAPLEDKCANAGTVQMRLGGTGRNIAHNLKLFGIDTYLITALGSDIAAQRITTSCNELGVHISRSLTLPSVSTSTTLFLANPNGEIALAVNDARIYDHLTPSFLASHLPFLNNAQILIIDTNLPTTTIEWLVENCHVPIFADTVSTDKSEKLRGALHRIHTIKANRAEAEKLSGIPLTSRNNIERAADVLLATGLRRIFITLGADGVFAADHRNRCLLPCLPAKVVNAKGCGDAFLAAVAWAFPEGTSLENTVYAGLAASSIAIESDDIVNPSLCATQVHQRSAAGRVRFQYPR